MFINVNNSMSCNSYSMSGGIILVMVVLMVVAVVNKESMFNNCM